MSVMATPHFYAVYSVFVFFQYVCTYSPIRSSLAASPRYMAHAGKDKDKERARVSVTAAPHPTPSPAGFVDGLSFSGAVCQGLPDP